MRRSRAPVVVALAAVALVFPPLSPRACARGAEAAATWSFAVGRDATVPASVTVSQQKVTVDLSALPAGAKVFRAVLHCRREAGRRDRVIVAAADRPEEPLALRAPRYASLDATEAVVRALAAGQGKLLLTVKAFSGWRRDSLRLDVAFVGGEARGAIPKVTGLSGAHRNGQTLLTWAEPDPPIAEEEVTFARWRAVQKKLAASDRQVRYRLYRSAEPIRAETIAKAALVDEVGPLTCWNPDYYGIYPKPDQNLPRYGVRPGADPVAPGTGLYAHNPPEAGKAYYAVAAAVNGEEDFSLLTPADGAASLAKPVVEVVGPGEPILQRVAKPKQFVYVRNPTLHYYVRWECPPRSNLPSRPFDYCVGVPAKPAKPAPVGIHLHCWGASLNGGYGWWYQASDGAMLISSNQIPYDWWVAYHEAWGTWKPWADGLCRDYSVKRMLAFADWVAARWDTDPSRMFVAGSSMGGAGAAMLAVRYPDRFAYGVSWVGIHIAARSPHFRGSYERVCGPLKENYRHESGLAVFDYLDGTFLLRTDPGRSIAFLTFANGR